MKSQCHILGPQYSTFVRSVQLCCEEKGINYQLGMEVGNQLVNFDNKRIYQYHPFGKVPVLTHNDQCYFETIVICRYLDSYFSGPCLLANSPSERAKIEQWAHCLAIYVDQVLIRQYLLEFTFPKGPDKTIRQSVVESIEPEVIRLINLLDREISTSAFFKTDYFTIADAILVPMLDYLAKLAHAERLFENSQYLLPYLARIRQRNSGQAVLL